jgi:hypothetical protein
MAITPRNVEHSASKRCAAIWRARRLDPSDRRKGHKERGVTAPFSCAAAEVQEHSDAASVGLGGNFVKAMSNGL